MKLNDTRRSAEFKEILGIIHSGRSKAFEAVNVALIETYWAIGEQLSRKVSDAGWGKGVVAELATWLAAEAPDLKGFSPSNLWRMKQFYETYSPLPKLATLLRELSWSKHLLLLSQCKSEEEKEFYLLSATRGRWSHRELERQIKKSAFERTMLSDLKLATVSRVLPDNAAGVFKDGYLLDFLDLPDTHSEADLQAALLLNLKKFLMELGDGFAFVGEKVRVQVGNQDFELDLLFYHRDLQCLVCVVDLDDAGGDGEKLCQLRGAEASRSRDDLKAFRVRADGDRLDEAVLPDAFCQLMQLGFFKRPARVGGGLVDGVESEELECTAVLHDCPPWAG